jgi:hypothetical protein
MWLFTRYGFYSIACGTAPSGSQDPNSVMVRARRIDHLQALQQRFSELASAPIVQLPHRDYRYRVIVAKDLWAEVVAKLVKEQDWSNFKNEVARYQSAAGSDYAHSLHEVWRIMYDLQQRETRAIPHRLGRGQHE